MCPAAKVPGRIGHRRKLRDDWSPTGERIAVFVLVIVFGLKREKNMSESEWTDDRLVHELTWAAEAVGHILKDGKSLLTMEAASALVRLGGWTVGVRKEWARRDTELKANCSHEWKQQPTAVGTTMLSWPPQEHCEKCGSTRTVCSASPMEPKHGI
jgi:hypothetical protein